LKVNRADKHLRELAADIKRFNKSNAYSVSFEPHHKAGEYVFRVYVDRPPPTIEWGIVIGDVVHNLRSALDQLVWEMADSESGPAPEGRIARSSPWHDVGFPIVTDPSHWKDAAKKIVRVGPRYSAAFESLQPWFRREAEPLRDPLAILQELSNRDKHRAVNLTIGYVRLVDFQTFGYRWHLMSEATLGPLEDQAEIARVRVEDPDFDPAEMDVYFHDSLDVTFREGEPAYGEPVIRLLDRLEQEVVRIIWKFQSL